MQNIIIDLKLCFCPTYDANPIFKSFLVSTKS